MVTFTTNGCGAGIAAVFTCTNTGLPAILAIGVAGVNCVRLAAQYTQNRAPAGFVRVHVEQDCPLMGTLEMVYADFAGDELPTVAPHI